MHEDIKIVTNNKIKNANYFCILDQESHEMGISRVILGVFDKVHVSRFFLLYLYYILCLSFI